MELIKFYTYIICCLVSIIDICAMDFSNYYSFGNTAHFDPKSLYIASLFVGTGECHIVRQGDCAIIIDAGKRDCSFNVACISYMLGHDIKDNIIKQATLKAVFLTHCDNDHTNMIFDIKDSVTILKDKTFGVYFGGQNSTYPPALFNAIKKKFNNGRHDFGKIKVLVQNVSPKLKSADDYTNRFGSVIGLEFANKKVAFVGDIDEWGFKKIVQKALDAQMNIINNDEKHNMCDFLMDADVVTAPHHGLLKNGESFVYATLAKKKKERVFLASGSPDGRYPMLSNIISYISNFKTLKENHTLSLLDYSLQKTTTNFNSEIFKIVVYYPLFSTYNAPHGFIWTKIDEKGIIWINYGNDFKQVL